MSEELDLLHHVRADVARVVELGSRNGALAAPVPACPDWTVRELIRHLGRVHRMVTSAIIEGRPPVRGSDDDAEPPTGQAELVEWLRLGADRMLDALDADPSHPAWAFDPQGGTVGFWQRRQAMENVIHRVDMEQALDARTPIAPALAADGVGEVLDVMVRLRRGEGRLTLPGGVVELQAQDVDQTWTLGDDGPTAHVAATAEQLFLGLWKRERPELLTQDPVALRILTAPLTP